MIVLTVLVFLMVPLAIESCSMSLAKVIVQVTEGSCKEYGAMNSLETQYMWGEGCYVKSEFGWVTKDRYEQKILGDE